MSDPRYRQWSVEKRDGSARLISSPCRALRRVQEALKPRLEACYVHPSAHGFRADHSIVTNARPHVGRAVVVNLDLADFYPSIRRERIQRCARWLTETEIDAVTLLDGTLPQGAITSPAIANLVCRKLDCRLHGFAVSIGGDFTRYADDLTISCGNDALAGTIVRVATSIIESEGFRVNRRKTRIMTASRRQVVTGVVVNEKPTLSRAQRRRIRAMFHQHPDSERVAGMVSLERMVRR